MLLCVFVSCKFVSQFCSETSALALRVLGFARRPYMENALGFSLGFTIISESAVSFDGLLTADYDRRLRQRELNRPGLNGGFERRSVAADRKRRN